MAEKLNPGEIKALISLLDDSDNEIFHQIETRLLSLGKEVIPILEDFWGNSFDAMLQGRIEQIVHKIQFESLLEELKRWDAFHRHDLFSGVVLIAHYQYPDLNEEKIRQYFNQLRRDVWIELNEQLTALEQINILNRVVFDVHGFSGNTANFHAPQNSFINIVLESKKGNPLLLSVIYMLLAQELDIPVYGVNLPEHFILCYQHSRQSPHFEYAYPDANILFYINAFSRGTIFGKEEVDAFLKKLKIDPLPLFYEPCTNTEILKRILRNLHFSYTKLGDTDKVAEIDLLLGVFGE